MQFLKYILLLLFSLSNFHETSRKMEITDLFDLKLIQEIKLFPDGNNILLLISESADKLDKRVTHLWKTNLTGVDPAKITNSIEGESYPQFMGKNKIAYLASNKGKQNIFVLDQNSGKEELLVTNTSSINAFCFSKDYKDVYFLSPPNGDKAIENGLISSFFKIDSIFPKSQLWKQSVESGKKEILTPSNFHVKAMNMSPDGKYMALTMTTSALPNDEIRSEIFLLNLDDNKLKQVTFNGAQEKSVSWFPNSKKLMFICDANKDMEVYYQHNIFLLDINEAKPRILLEDLKYEIHSAWFIKKGMAFIILRIWE